MLLLKVLQQAEILVLIACLFLPFNSNADVATPVREVSQLTKPQPENAVQVKTARITMADYDLIRRDFPHIRLASGQLVESRLASETDIDAWLLAKAGYVSMAQAAQSRLNSPVQVAVHMAGPLLGQPISTVAYRPQLYGRALVFTAENGLIDVKGVGTNGVPQFQNHGTGLASLGEMIREFIFQKKVQQILDHSGSGFRTVGSYAVIDWGFEGADPFGNFSPAGAILRQAHSRKFINGVQARNHFADIVTSKLIEDVLRRYGVSSAGDSEGAAVDRVNIQVAATGEIVDFGAFFVKAHFAKPLVEYAAQAHMDSPTSHTFVQPDPRMSLAGSAWGASESGREHPRYDNPWVWSHNLAQDLKTGKAQRHNAEKHLRDMLLSGPLPPELAGSCENVKTERFRQQTIIGMIKSLPANEPPSLELLTAYLKSTQAGSPDRNLLAAVITPERLSKRYGYAYFEVLKQHHVFDRFPELAEQVLASSTFEGPEALLWLLKHGRLEAIETAIKNRRVWSVGFRSFFSSAEAKASPKWAHWIALNMQYDYPDFGPAYLRDEPMTGQHPELFLKLLERETGLAMIQALNRPHWKQYPKLVDRAIQSMQTNIKDPATKTLFIEALLKSETWREHPRQAIWQNLVTGSPANQCQALFESLL